MKIADIAESIKTLRTCVALLRELGEARNALKEAELKKKLQETESKLDEFNSAFAKSLGFKLCYCQYPPPIMLFDKDKEASVCPQCGHEVRDWESNLL